ncbi:hypothetical protein PAYE108092_15845 [Paracoccus yeei]|uniref:Uncharacterized protein n=1 Tax=Paracoccus yeei TaxID=147645 RepID=A0A0D5A1U3_9RHOB|nr:hypothetical protein pLM20P5_p28 [Paracoccus yeei]
MIDLTTRYSDEITKIPTIQRGLRPTAAPGLIVGREEPAACPPPVCTAPNPPSPLSVSPAVTAKPERIAEGGPVKARQRAPSRHERRVERDRLARFRDAALFAYAMDWPLNVGLTITWTALQVAGERNEGHCLGRGEWAREKYTPCHIGGERHWFLCPARGCGQRVAVIYGGGIFACRKCHQLAYPSQREDIADRAGRRADRIRSRLGWPAGVLNGSDFGKPKGMHWHTYERLCREHDVFSDRTLKAIADQLNLWPHRTKIG